jgi:hypothetical protein
MSHTAGRRVNGSVDNINGPSLLVCPGSVNHLAGTTGTETAMLRYGFLPSDFNPMLLILGEAADLSAFAATLRRYAAAPRRMSLAEAGHAGAAEVVLTPDGAPGLRADGAGRFAWTLDAEAALAHAALVEDLAAPDRLAGSEMLGPEAPSEALGLPVKVSRGEYREELLAA